MILQFFFIPFFILLPKTASLTATFNSPLRFDTMSAALKHPHQDISAAFQVEERVSTLYFCSRHSFFIHTAPPFHSISHHLLAHGTQDLRIVCAHCGEGVDTTKDHGHLVQFRVRHDSAFHYLAADFRRQGFSGGSTRKHTHFWKHVENTCYYCNLPIEQHSTHLQIDEEWHTHQQTAACNNGNCQDFYHLRGWLCTKDCSCTATHCVE